MCQNALLLSTSLGQDFIPGYWGKLWWRMQGQLRIIQYLEPSIGHRREWFGYYERAKRKKFLLAVMSKNRAFENNNISSSVY